jgi:hypothetical protein
MTTNANKLIFKRLVREYEFLLEDLKDIESADSEIKDSFMQSLSDIDTNGVLETEEIENMSGAWAQSNKEVADAEKESNKHPEFKSLFRKVVLRCHPDKLSSELTESEFNEYKEIYENSVNANETEDWAKLIRCALKLELEIPESAYDQIEAIEKSINKLKQKQENILNSTAWSWYKTNDNAAKSDILKQHLDFMALLTKKK